MPHFSETAITQTSQALMQAVVNSGCIRSADQDADVAVRVMREELKAFMFEPRYADERQLTLTGNSSLAMASLVSACVSRIIKERVQ